jgi:hypothetical protein
MNNKKIKINKDDIDICVLIQNPGQFLVKNEKYIFNEVLNTYQVLFHLKDINDKYIHIINNEKFKLHIPMKRNGNNITVIIDTDLTEKNSRTNIINCPFYTKIV